MVPATTLALTDGRTLAYDDVGDPAGLPVLYVHGTPDSRRARHPDDELATAAGVRLVAIDRPGFGGSSPHPAGTLGSFADDAVALADHLGIDRWRPFAWSGGATYAVAVAARHPRRTARVAVAAGLVPFEAYATEGILDDADGGRHLVAELGAEVGPEGLAEMAAPMLVPYPCDEALALEHVTEQLTPDRRAVVDAIPGAVEALAAGVFDSVAQGLGGITRDLELQVLAPDVDWTAATVPVDLWYGSQDATAPPAFGEWWAEALPDATLHVFPTEGHLIALTRWAAILEALAG
ncbi:alpha/beta fold hydrolase [Aquihabitans sp. McL0605]|uniref:alpha/beta fold hydrolase n=1 Tax=Aquihabitans sp. McL0605 TaxID=3415671 RepID=UPI003CF8A7FA